jgi:hypothetical protein
VEKVALKKKLEMKKLISTAAGFEPARAWPNGFLVHLLNHSDKQSLVDLCGKQTIELCGLRTERENRTRNLQNFEPF